MWRGSGINPTLLAALHTPLVLHRLVKVNPFPSVLARTGPPDALCRVTDWKELQYAVTHLESVAVIRDKSAVSRLLESREWHRIKAISNNNNNRVSRFGLAVRR